MLNNMRAITQEISFTVSMRYIIFFYGILLSTICIAEEPNYKLGAYVYAARCTLCHGNYGMGEGTIPLLISGYASTNLLTQTESYTDNKKELYNQIAFGSELKGISDLMPPWKNELSEDELYAVTDFILYLRSDNAKARSLINSVSAMLSPTIRTGRNIFISRCALCHGTSGEGDGKLSKTIQKPPPFNLTHSNLPDDMLINIIRKGGEGVNRSPSMPAWGDELTEHELKSVIMYLKTLRH